MQVGSIDESFVILGGLFVFRCAYGMDARAAGLDAMAGEDYAEEARVLWMVMRLEQRW